MLKKQLIKINGRMRYFEKAKKNGKELENLLQDAQRRVEMADGFKYEGDAGKGRTRTTTSYSCAATR